MDEAPQAGNKRLRSIPRGAMLGGSVVAAVAAGALAALLVGGGSDGEVGGDPAGGVVRDPSPVIAAAAADAVEVRAAPPAAPAQDRSRTIDEPPAAAPAPEDAADVAAVPLAPLSPETVAEPPADGADVTAPAPEVVAEQQTPASAAVAEQAAPAPPEPAVPSPELAFGPFALPIAWACLPTFAGQLPNAPRAYRNGIHEGVDFYPGAVCAAVALGTPVLAAASGAVVRADWEYADLTVDEYAEMQARGFTGAGDLDRFRGRQVWIDHGGGVVTRYAHLSGIAEGIAPGVAVTAGRVVGFVGESGTPGGLAEPGSQIHLHFEVRVGESYLGAGLAATDVLALYQALFP